MEALRVLARVSGRTWRRLPARPPSECPFFHDVAAVGDDRRQPDLQAVGDLLVHIWPQAMRARTRLRVKSCACEVSGACVSCSWWCARGAYAGDIAYDGLFRCFCRRRSVHCRIGRLRLPVAKQDRLVAQRAEDELCDEIASRDEEVEETVPLLCANVSEIAEKFIVGHRDDLSRDGFSAPRPSGRWGLRWLWRGRCCIVLFVVVGFVVEDREGPVDLLGEDGPHGPGARRSCASDSSVGRV